MTFVKALVKAEQGVAIFRQMRGRTSGFAIPQYVLDTPHGKVPLDYPYLRGREGDDVVVESYRPLNGTVSEVRIAGGGAKGPLWRKIVASALGLPMVTVNSTEGGAFGEVGAYEQIDARVTFAVDPAAEVIVEQPALALCVIDGNHGLGPAVARHAVDAAMEAARGAGIGKALGAEGDPPRFGIGQCDGHGRPECR